MLLDHQRAAAESLPASASSGSPVGAKADIRGRGRRKSIPEALFVTVERLRLAGLGYRRIANELNALGVATSRGSVERLVKGLPPYEDAG